MNYEIGRQIFDKGAMKFGSQIELHFQHGIVCYDGLTVHPKVLACIEAVRKRETQCFCGGVCSRLGFPSDPLPAKIAPPYLREAFVLNAHGTKDILTALITPKLNVVDLFRHIGWGDSYIFNFLNHNHELNLLVMPEMHETVPTWKRVLRQMGVDPNYSQIFEKTPAEHLIGWGGFLGEVRQRAYRWGYNECFFPGGGIFDDQNNMYYGEYLVPNFKMEKILPVSALVRVRI
jgi:hypothetical protein